MFELLKKLCALNGASGDESAVADFITGEIGAGNTVVQKDNMGNVLVFKKGGQTPNKKIMFAAHMDEVGFIVTDITEEGFLRFSPVGGISPSAVFGRSVIFKNGARGVIGGVPVHLLNEDEKGKQPDVEDLLIDIGASDKTEAEKHVRRGDCCCFCGEFSRLGGGRISAKAIDDRLGCAIMLDMLRTDLEYDCSFAFTVQEEIGCRGAAAAAFNLEPDICVILEATTACDIPGVSESDRVCGLGMGTAVSYMDKSAVYDKELYNMAFEVARKNNLKCQTKTKITGGNDGGAIHKALGGIRTIALSCPCRYLHTPSCVIDGGDLTEMRILAGKLLNKFALL
ncbi:MAG: M42 family peptidase [Oscillospiraceae bacterium]|jgi:endoglucanase|nr:M42 family peptidase [Oscillospiraceae bacterium]